MSEKSKIDGAELVEYLAKRVMGWGPGSDWSPWEPLESLDDAWMMVKKLRVAKCCEFPLFLSLSDDGGFYFRANVYHQYDHMLVSSVVDEESPCRAICMAVYEAMQIEDGSKEWDKPRFWQMWCKDETPKVGVGVIIRDNSGRILLQKRKGAHGEGEWSLPGGHMELGECFDGVCKREVKEETGIPIAGVKPLFFTNDIFEEDGLHYVTLFFEAYWDASIWKEKARIMEPNKTTEMGWFSKGGLPTPLFPPLDRFREQGGALLNGTE